MSYEWVLEILELNLTKALVHPFLKKPALGPLILDNFCPGSKQPFLGWASGCIWASEDPEWSIWILFSQVSDQGMLLDDLWLGQEVGGASIFDLLDYLSATFDTIDYVILLDWCRGLWVRWRWSGCTIQTSGRWTIRKKISSLEEMDLIKILFLLQS